MCRIPGKMHKHDMIDTKVFELAEGVFKSLHPPPPPPRSIMGLKYPET